MGALIKYPTNSEEFDSKDSDIRKHKLGYFCSENETFKRISKETGTWIEENDVARHPLTFLMEAADDIAYSTADLEDAFKKKLITLQEFIQYFEANMENEKKAKLLIDNLKERMTETVNAEEQILRYRIGWTM